MIGGGADRSTPVAETRALYDAAPGPKSLWLVEGAGHAATGSVWTDEYRRRVRALFAASLGEPGSAGAGAQPDQPHVGHDAEP